MGRTKKEKNVDPKLVCNHKTRPTRVIGDDGRFIEECVLCYTFLD